MDRIEKEIRRLFKLAEKEENPDYIKRARELLERSRKQLPGDLRAKFCKNCNTCLKPGDNCSVRIKGDTIIMHCNNCKTTKRTKAKHLKHFHI